MKNRQSRRAFTLVELLIVISIIAVLASLTMPALGRARLFVNKITATNSARNIAQAWNGYARGEKNHTIAKDTVYQWAGVLAQHEMNNPKEWILDFDPLVQEKLGEGAPMPSVISNKRGTKWVLSEEFQAFPLSWEVANRIRSTADGSHPLLWTSGLQSSGTWDNATGVFGDKGGIIARVDLSVTWYDALKDDEAPRGRLSRISEDDSRMTIPTADIGEAIFGGEKNILRSPRSY